MSKKSKPCSARGNRPKLAAKAALCATALVCLAGGTGCENVKPWQRGTLAEGVMRPDRDPLGVSLGEHVYFSREEASGGRGVGGGGCGCN